jgi:hypothetical protein
MHEFGLRRGHAGHPITAGDLAAGCDRGVAVHTDPHHVQTIQQGARSLLRARTAQEDIIDDDARPGTSHGRDAGGPGGLRGPEALADLDLALSAELDAAIGVQQRRR